MSKCVCCGQEKPDLDQMLNKTHWTIRLFDVSVVAHIVGYALDTQWGS